MKKLALLFLMAALPWFVFAQADPIAADLEEEPCPNPKKLRGLCAMEENRMMDRKNNEYLYTTRLLEASCLSGDEANEVVNKKIRDAWTAMEDEFVCDSSQFDVIK